MVNTIQHHYSSEFTVEDAEAFEGALRLAGLLGPGGVTVEKSDATLPDSTLVQVSPDDDEDWPSVVARWQDGEIEDEPILSAAHEGKDGLDLVLSITAEHLKPGTSAEFRGASIEGDSIQAYVVIVESDGGQHYVHLDQVYTLAH